MPAPTKVTPLRRGDEIAHRVAAYVNEQFDGNITAASKAIGCESARLWYVATGRRKISIHLLQLLARQSGRSVDWWLTGVET